MAPAETVDHELTLAAYQRDVGSFMDRVTASDPTDLAERAARYAEEALETVRSAGLTRMGGHALVDLVFDQDHIGDLDKEIGGSLLTLAALAHVAGHDLAGCAAAEIARVATPEVEARFRAKRAARRKGSVLPGQIADLAPDTADPEYAVTIRATMRDVQDCALSCLAAMSVFTTSGYLERHWAPLAMLGYLPCLLIALSRATDIIDWWRSRGLFRPKSGVVATLAGFAGIFTTPTSNIASLADVLLIGWGVWSTAAWVLSESDRTRPEAAPVHDHSLPWTAGE